MFPHWHGIVIAVSVSVAQLLIAPGAAFGQTTSTDTTAGTPSDTLAAAAPGDSLPASGDSLPAPGDTMPAPGDTAAVARDTVDTLSPAGSDTAAAAGSADTARSPGDSAPAGPARDSARPAAPVDSILSTACGGPASSATIARDLLVVVFAPDAGPEERAAAADSVGGKVLGPAEPGAWYVKLAAESGEAGLRAAADQLSLMAQVRQVGSRACPS